ncbi:MAG TPA: multiheme c-type cytochrome, partial [Bacteroidales bacterium]
MKNWKITGIIATAILVLAIPLYLLKGYFSGNHAIQKEAQFVGGKQCIECHEPQYKLWKDSNHDKAMDTMSEFTVRGDFNNAEFEHNGFVHRFYKKDGKYFVHTLGKDGEPADLEITYTFGTKPLQQYLIPFEDGRLQCLPIAWDTIANRWYHLYDSVYKGQDIKPDDWLYWTNNGQNWNGMCAECHSTNLNKGFDPKTKVFNTTWSDIDVNCEACHGPGSEHLEWAKLPEMARPTDVNTGLIVQTSNISSRKYVDQCAYCHARRSGLGYYPNNGAALLDHIVPGLPTPPNYFVDGQILEEDYEHGSFTQSKMYMKGVKCNDCHNVHSLKLVKQGNDLCLQCHVRENYDNYNHTFHKKIGEEGKDLVLQKGKKIVEVGEGSLCINCHMTGKYYMGVHYRHDHSFRIPRPDLTIELGTPNACNQCHSDKTPQWSLDYVTKWYGEKKRTHYGTVLAAARKGDINSFPQLQSLVESDLTPPIIRASLLEMANSYPSELTSNVYNQALGDTIPLVRLIAMNNYSTADIANL